ncbi:protein TSS [Tanacetum coccineum]|uniref:Protein TSS n=1 Tax=Tanacetum coccineum TaxID=301880 RepID=A0ABQ5AD18_9ASTR
MVKVCLPPANRNSGLLRADKEGDNLKWQGVVNLRYYGYTAVVKVVEIEDDKKVPPLRYIELLDQPIATNLKNELKVEGLGTPLRSLKNKKKDSEGNNMESKADDAVNGEVENYVLNLAESQLEASATENESALKKLLSDAAFTRLKESETGLHRMVSLVELIDQSQKYYNGVALAKLVMQSYKYHLILLLTDLYIGPDVSISTNARVGAGVRLINCIILDDAEIKAGDLIARLNPGDLQEARTTVLFNVCLPPANRNSGLLRADKEGDNLKWRDVIQNVPIDASIERVILASDGLWKDATNLKNELKVEGLGTPLRSLKNKKKDSEGNNMESKANDAVNGEVENYVLNLAESQLEASATENESALKKLLSDAAFTRLKDSETRLHRMVSLVELIDQSQKYYNGVALAKLVMQSYKYYLILLLTDLYIGPDVSISTNARVGAGVRLMNCIILDDAEIKLLAGGHMSRLKETTTRSLVKPILVCLPPTNRNSGLLRADKGDNLKWRDVIQNVPIDASIERVILASDGLWKAAANLKNELKVEGLGTPLRSLKNKKKDSEGNNMESKADDAVNGEVENYVLNLAESQLEASATENESALKKLLSDAAFTRLKESKTGLHRMVSLVELIDQSQKYYNGVALAKLVMQSNKNHLILLLTNLYNIHEMLWLVR